MLVSHLAAVFLQLTLLGPGTKYNSLRIAFGGIFQLGSATYLFSISNCQFHLTFMLVSQLAAVFLQLTLLGPWTKYNSLKIAFGGNSLQGSASYLFERIKLLISSNFHVVFTTSSSVFTINSSWAWDQVQQS